MALKTFSMNELATLLGVTRQTLDRWVKQGCPYVERADRDVGKEWRLSLPAVVEWRERQAVEKAVGDTRGLSLEAARERKMAAEAGIAEAQLARIRAEQVSLNEVLQIVGDKLAVVSTRMKGVGPKVAPLVGPVTDIGECRRIIDDAIVEAIHELTGIDAGSFGGREGEDRQGGRRDDIREPEAAPEADGKRVGRPRKKAER
jgi:phage terminase Nu1 subunit (DNA packaging protein)